MSTYYETLHRCSGLGPPEMPLKNKKTKRQKTAILSVVLHEREIFLHALKQAYVSRIEQ
jgi:hypothetical protein